MKCSLQHLLKTLNLPFDEGVLALLHVYFSFMYFTLIIANERSKILLSYTEASVKEPAKRHQMA